jgi:hypothetical protein
VETSNRIKDFLCALVISDWKSEPYHENQNFAEICYATIKAAINRLLNQSGALADFWLLAVQFVCHVLNRLASSNLKWIPPLQVLSGQTQDISALLVCAFWEPVYYNPHSNCFPSHHNEELGHWVGVATHVRDALTFKILSPHQKVIYRSIIWSALDPKLRHKRLAPLGGEVSHAADKLFLRSKSDKATTDEPSVPRRMPTIDPKDLLGLTFLKD